jgi:hypothetical protein
VARPKSGVFQAGKPVKVVVKVAPLSVEVNKLVVPL